jgi:hypothetical protein
VTGKLKAKKPQYHNLIEKSKGLELYEAFIAEFKKQIAENNAKIDRQGKVEHGVYGNRQGLKMDSPGPSTHIFDF